MVTVCHDRKLTVHLNEAKCKFELLSDGKMIVQIIMYESHIARPS